MQADCLVDLQTITGLIAEDHTLVSGTNRDQVTGTNEVLHARNEVSTQ
jgi:hypothetical protein